MSLSNVVCVVTHLSLTTPMNALKVKTINFAQSVAMRGTYGISADNHTKDVLSVVKTIVHYR